MRQKGLLAALSTLLAIPLVLAAPFENLAQAMGLAWNAVGSLFSFQFVSESPFIREGILKFLIFVLVFRVVMYALSGIGRSGNGFFDKKTAGIVGFVVAIVTVIFTPNTYLFAGVIALGVPIALIFSLAWVGMMVLRGDWLKNLMGAMVLLVTSFVAAFAVDMFKTWNTFNNEELNGWVVVTLSIIHAIILILFVVKLLMTLFEGGDGLFRGGAPWGGNRDGNRGTGPDGARPDGTGPDGARPDGTRPGAGSGEGDLPGNGGVLDNSNPGRIRVFVHDTDGVGIPGATLKIFPLGTSVARRIFRRGTPNNPILTVSTDVHGWWPSEDGSQQIGSGPIRVEARKGVRSNLTDGVIPPGDDVYEVRIKLGGRNTPAEGFEPHIQRVRRVGDDLVVEAYVDNDG